MAHSLTHSPTCASEDILAGRFRLAATRLGLDSEDVALEAERGTRSVLTLPGGQVYPPASPEGERSRRALLRIASGEESMGPSRALQDATGPAQHLGRLALAPVHLWRRVDGGVRIPFRDPCPLPFNIGERPPWTPAAPGGVEPEGVADAVVTALAAHDDLPGLVETLHDEHDWCYGGIRELLESAGAIPSEDTTCSECGAERHDRTDSDEYLADHLRHGLTEAEAKRLVRFLQRRNGDELESLASTLGLTANPWPDWTSWVDADGDHEAHGAYYRDAWQQTVEWSGVPRAIGGEDPIAFAALVADYVTESRVLPFDSRFCYSGALGSFSWRYHAATRTVRQERGGPNGLTLSIPWGSDRGVVEVFSERPEEHGSFTVEVAEAKDAPGCTLALQVPSAYLPALLLALITPA